MIIVGVMTWLAFRWARQPIINSANVNSSVQSIQLENINYETDYFKTLIPSEFIEKTKSTTPKLPLLGQYLLRHKVTTYVEQIAITIGQLPAGGIEEVSDLKLRRTDKKNYTLIPYQSFAPQNSISYASNNSQETAIFWSHETRYAIVVFIGSTARSSTSSQVISTIVGNWNWK
jgi:hypothetical protein